LRGGFSDNITNTDLAYHFNGKATLTDKFKFSKPLDDDDNSKHTANIINEFLEQSYKVLSEHRINKERKKRGLLPANIILTRDGSTDLPKLKKFKKWASIVNMPLELGISKALNMKPFSFDYPEMKGKDVYETLYLGLKRMCKFTKKTSKKRHKKFDYFYVHFKETDVPGHDNKPHEKKWMIEYIDKHFFSFLKDFAEKNNIKVIVTADHATPCKLKAHSANPVPLLFCDWQGKKKKQFGEKAGKKGKLGKVYGKGVLDLF
jgi:2,3-bisphosphoglycerate-independent phosphoglycerate mutase